MEFQFTSSQAKAMAEFAAELVRQGVTYKVRQLVDGWSVTLTGGY